MDSLMANTEVFKKLTASPLTATLPDGSTLVCRPLPFATLGDVLQLVLTHAEKQLDQARDEFVNILEEMQRTDEKRLQLAHSMGMEAPDEPSTNLVQMARLLLPFFKSAVLSVPQACRAIIMACVPGITDEDYKTLTVEQALAIVHPVIEALDAEFISEKLAPIFTKATYLVIGVRRLQPEQTSEQQEQNVETQTT